MKTLAHPGWLLVTLSVACAAPASAQRPDAQALVGSWKDSQEDVTTIELRDGQLLVTSVVDFEEIPYRSVESSWDGDAFTWSYYAPSAQMNVTVTVLTVAASELRVRVEYDTPYTFEDVLVRQR